MNSKQLKSLITTVLMSLGQYSAEAVDLLLLTAAQESQCGKYIRQLNGGPALGIFQMELETLNDLYANFLMYRPYLSSAIAAFRSNQTLHIDLEGNLLFQIAAARLQYLRKPGALPKASSFSDDFSYVDALAKYWKRNWNTELGAGTVDEAIQNYYRYVIKEAKDAA